MTVENKLDEYRVDTMIETALTEDRARLPALKALAEKFRGASSEPAEALAALLVGKISKGTEVNLSDKPVVRDEWPTVPCTENQWKYFMGRCRRAGHGSGTLSLWGQDYDFVSHRHPGFEGKHHPQWYMARYARICQWPARIPGPHERVIFQENKDQDIGWAWAWMKDEQMLKDMCTGQVCSWVKRPEVGRWVPDSLLMALKAELVQIPKDCITRFVVSFCRLFDPLFGDDPTDYVRHLCVNCLGFTKDSLQKTTPEDLQHLACFHRLAAVELARRCIPLSLPLIQLREAWIDGYLYSGGPGNPYQEGGPLALRTGDPQRDAIIFLDLATVEQYAFDHGYTRANRSGPNPDDPFGSEVNLWIFYLRKNGVADNFSAKRPSYEECLQHLEQRLAKYGSKS